MQPVGLSTLPYDLLLNIAIYLDLRDVHALHLTCKSLYDASTTRPVYRKLAVDLLRRCRALPLKGFQRLSDLSTENLIHAVNKATHYETAWRNRAPRPIEGGEGAITPKPTTQPKMSKKFRGQRGWYKIVSAPPGEEVDWLSPITSSYTLCATKSGKVVCWDVQTDRCLAEWNPGARWELWKCRVEFEERTVFFTMAKVLSGYDDDRIMEFVLMKLTFSDPPSGTSSPSPPIFSHVTDFRTTGVVMNVFLLDPGERLLSAFIWVSASNTIGLYALPDWGRREYVFIDTGIECVMSSNWSCILFQNHIVIHCEESDAAYQHFYPLALLRTFITALPPEDHASAGAGAGSASSNSTSTTAPTPVISRRVPPVRTLKKKFKFPMEDDDMVPTNNTNGNIPISNGNGSGVVVAGPSHHLLLPHLLKHHNNDLLPPHPPPPFPPPPPPPNPFPFPPWYPESAHFVRQWWPSLPSIPRVSCTVVLLAAHDPQTHGTRFVLAQHYFRVPLDRREWAEGIEGMGVAWEGVDAAAAAGVGVGVDVEGGGGGKKGKGRENGHVDPHLDMHAQDTPSDMEAASDDALMHLWYVSKPFEVVRDDDTQALDRPRPLVAVDFGHAVWIEYVRKEAECAAASSSSSSSSASASNIKNANANANATSTSTSNPFEGQVRTLETPPELDLAMVETINIDQSQGAVILSDKAGRIFILCYE
ncbi:hypothetical protein CPB84DRAFT_1679333 [Gymnopilus junonius]|uniref:F-box domain-containing protein n=1 Tax=Gymnopilus junonius TaxID=109634 RepID=A0A9P5TMW2_GYMJU|nr:hypothetical protein CPB84DRAFT_1679333 [Gymnopilus junonius]